VQDAPAANTHGFLSKDTWVSSTPLNRPISKKRAYQPLEKPKLQDA
jgi:hypothetical protein